MRFQDIFVWAILPSVVVLCYFLRIDPVVCLRHYFVICNLHYHKVYCILKHNFDTFNINSTYSLISSEFVWINLKSTVEVLIKIKSCWKLSTTIRSESLEASISYFVPNLHIFCTHICTGYIPGTKVLAFHYSPTFMSSGHQQASAHAFHVFWDCASQNVTFIHCFIVFDMKCRTDFVRLVTMSNSAWTYGCRGQVALFHIRINVRASLFSDPTQKVQHD